MNSEEGMSLAKMAVSVLLVVLVIGAVVAIVYKAYSWFNSGTSKLGDQVNSIDASAYSQYDDNQISGTDVLTALKTYRDSDIAIFITNHSKGAAMLTGFNYCAKSTEMKDGKVTLEVSDGLLRTAGIEWDTSTGLAARNTNFSPTTTKSKTEQYVKQGGQYFSKLVYSNETDEVCGIYFCDMSKWDPKKLDAPGGDAPKEP